MAALLEVLEVELLEQVELFSLPGKRQARIAYVLDQLIDLAVLGVDVGDRWLLLAKLWEPMMFDARSPFNDLHALLAFRNSNHEDLIDLVDLDKAAKQNLSLKHIIHCRRAI